MDVKERTVRDRLVMRLKDLDLPTNESMTYITLLTHSAMTASAICKETSIPDSKIYYALDNLSRKGMITVQKGNPNVYLPAPPQEAISNLKNQMLESINEKISEADALTNVLVPIYENAEKSEEFEVAYIIRGQKNIINRMKALIQMARKEITFFTSFLSVFRELKASLIEAKEKRRVKLNIALTQEVYRKEDCSDLGEVRLLCCSAESSISSLGMLISDMKTLLTLSDIMEETAMLTQDKNLIQVTRGYFDNPTCCTKTG